MKKPLKVAAWSGLISAILVLIVFPLSFFAQLSLLLKIFVILGSIIAGVLGIFFAWGFVVLAKKFDAKLLYVMSWVGIIVSIFSLIIGLFINLVSLFPLVSAQQNSFNSGLDSETALAFAFAFLFFWVIISVLAGVYSILFGIGLIKIKNKAKYANTAGILNIVAGATYIILIGFFVRIVAFIFEIIILFNASKKFEK